MRKDGHETPSIKERLTAKSATDLRELEGLILKEQARLAESLRQSSKDALTTIANSTDAQIKEIEEMIRARHSSMTRMLQEIEIKPQLILRKIMITSAVTGAMIAMIPWGIISYLGINVMEATGIAVDRRMDIRREEAKLDVLKQFNIVETREGLTVLMLPEGTEEILACGTPGDRMPCILISEAR